MELTKDQKDFLIKESETTTDLIELTRKCFDNPLLDGRSREGRAVRKFLTQANIEYDTTRREKKEDISFTDQQKEFILQQTEFGLSSFRIAQLLFPKEDIQPLSKESRAVLDYLKESNPDFVPSEGGSLKDYSAPKASSRIVSKINDATGLSLEDGKLNRQFQICVEKLGVNLNNSRFVRIMNNYTDKDDRDLFEQEFIRLTWDKPDLTADEVNLYLNVCKEVINLEVISKHLNKLNEMFDVADDQQEMTVRLAEIIKTKSSEYHQCESRIENLTKKLQGDRAQRMQSKAKENASILSLVQFFQEKEERDNMVKMAEMEKKLVKKDAERLESMEQWKARWMGVGKDNVI